MAARVYSAPRRTAQVHTTERCNSFSVDAKPQRFMTPQMALLQAPLTCSSNSSLQFVRKATASRLFLVNVHISPKGHIHHSAADTCTSPQPFAWKGFKLKWLVVVSPDPECAVRKCSVGRWYQPFKVSAQNCCCKYLHESCCCMTVNTALRADIDYSLGPVRLCWSCCCCGLMLCVLQVWIWWSFWRCITYSYQYRWVTLRL